MNLRLLAGRELEQRARRGSIHDRIEMIDRQVNVAIERGLELACRCLQPECGLHRGIIAQEIGEGVVLRLALAVVQSVRIEPPEELFRTEERGDRSGRRRVGEPESHESLRYDAGLFELIEETRVGSSFRDVHRISVVPSRASEARSLRREPMSKKTTRRPVESAWFNKQLDAVLTCCQASSRLRNHSGGGRGCVDEFALKIALQMRLIGFH